MMQNLPPIIPTTTGGPSRTSGPPLRHFGGDAKTSLFDHDRDTRVSVDQAMHGVHKPSTSVAHMGQESSIQTSVFDKKEADTTISVAGRSREDADAISDDKRYAYARSKLFVKKKQEEKSQLKLVKKTIDERSKIGRRVMKHIVEKYSWKKPLTKHYDLDTQRAMKKEIDAAQDAKHLSDEEVENMKGIIKKIK